MIRLGASIVVGLSLASPAAPSYASSVKIIVQTTNGTGVPSKIVKLENGTREIERTESDGTKVYDPFVCRPNIKFMVLPVSPTYARTNEVRKCTPSITFVVTRFILSR